MNNIAEKNFLLSPKGLLIQPAGLSQGMIYDYDRNAVPPLRRFARLKEHDRYIFGNSSVLVELELCESGYAGILTASVVNLDSGFAKTTVLTSPLSFGKIELPESPLRGDVIFRAGEEASLDFSISTGKRYVRARIDRFDDVRSLYVNITLEESKADSCCSLSSFSSDPECFSLNCRRVCLPASGSVVYGADTFNFSPADSFGCLDWERAVLPKSPSCCWYFMQGSAEGVPLSLSFSSVSDEQRPDVNGVIYDGVLYDPGDVRLIIGSDSEDGSLRLRSVNSRVDVVFTPAASSFCEPKAARFSLGTSERIFGRWSGTVRLGNGKPVEVSEMAGFIEKRRYRW